MPHSDDGAAADAGPASGNGAAVPPGPASTDSSVVDAAALRHYDDKINARLVDLSDAVEPHTPSRLSFEMQRPNLSKGHLPTA